MIIVSLIYTNNANVRLIRAKGVISKDFDSMRFHRDLFYFFATQILSLSWWLATTIYILHYKLLTQIPDNWLLLPIRINKSMW